MSKFTSFEAKKLFKLYKHAAKKREESKSQEVREALKIAFSHCIYFIN